MPRGWLGARTLLLGTAVIGLALGRPRPSPRRTRTASPATATAPSPPRAARGPCRSTSGRSPSPPRSTARLGCVACHADLAGEGAAPRGAPQARGLRELPPGEQEQHARSLHGKAIARGDPLAPRCKDCHGNHDIVPVKDPRSAVAPLKVPVRVRPLPPRGHARPAQPADPPGQHPRELLREHPRRGAAQEGPDRGGQLRLLPHGALDPAAHRPAPPPSRGKNIAATCTQCHAEIEQVHRKVIRGELWEKQANVLPACVDCHQPHKVRKVFYAQGMADADCLRCHADPGLKARDGRSSFADGARRSRARATRRSPAASATRG